MSALSILIVEDDPELAAVLVRALEQEGFEAIVAGTGTQALALAAERAPDAIVLDIGLPDADGRDVCHALRSRGTLAPVLFLTALDALTDRLAGFGAGGDDYLTKPFSPAELTARLQALLRRAGADPVAEVGLLTLDPTNFEVAAGGREVRLTPTEFRLLGALVAREGTVARRALIRVAWPEGAIVHDNTIDVYIARLRRKLRELPDAPKIVTVHGVGYRIQ